jgi:hypothetical protein
MSERRAPRLILEVAFLAALAAALTFADLERYAIVGVMLLGWLLVAIFEWGALRTRPHYGSGSPPRWYSPQVKLPPPRPLEQFSAGYPAAEAASDAPTWIASPAMLAEWPVAADVDSAAESVVDEETHEHDVHEAELAIAVADETTHTAPPEFDEELEPEDEEFEVEEPEVEPEPRRKIEPRPVQAGERTARHRIDPLATPPAKGRRFARRSQAVTGDLDVADGPPRRRLLPAQARGED